VGGRRRCGGARARRFRHSTRRLRATRAQRRRRGAADAPLQREVFSGLRGRRRELSGAPGRTAGGGGGSSEWWAAPRFFMWFLCPVAQSQPYRGPTEPWRGGSVLHFARLTASPLSFAILLSGTLALALGCALPLDLDLYRLRQLRRRKEPIQLKRCRALSSAHDIHTSLQLSSAKPWRGRDPSSCSHAAL
jgi:hypothetical protein